MAGIAGRSGGRRPGAGRKPTYKRVELTDFVAELISQVIKEAELLEHPTNAQIIANTILRETLTNDRAAWVATFRQHIDGAPALEHFDDYAKAP